MVKNLVIMGSTGSVGRQALQVVDECPEAYNVVGLAAGSNVKLLLQQIEKYQPRYVSVASREVAVQLKCEIDNNIVKVYYGKDGLAELAQLPGVNLILIAVTGIHGLEPTLIALENKIPVALANKETLVAGGQLVMKKARETETPIIPVDSEHSAVFQCIEESNRGAIDRILLTASGGPFINFSQEELEIVTPEQALKHPKWNMGKKITIDSAGLINKGLEVIEAYWLFGVPYEKIQIVVHPQSIIHSMVQYTDGVVMAQLGMPDMRVPIQYAYTYPHRSSNTFPKINFFELEHLTFLQPDMQKFHGLTLAYEAGKIGGTMPIVYNAANEVAVELFLNNHLKFTNIPVLIEKVMSMHASVENFCLEEIIEIDQWVRVMVKKLTV